jgi:hypothetical protein
MHGETVKLRENVFNGHVHITDGRELCRKTFKNGRRGQIMEVLS